MIFLFPLLFIIFVLLLVMRIMGGHIGWFWVGVPGILFIIAILAFLIQGFCAHLAKRKKNKSHD